MLSYNYTSGYDFLSYMEYPVLLLQEYALIYYAFKYQDLLGKRTQLVAVFYSIVATLIYLKLFPVIINITLRTFTSAVSVCVCVFLCLDEFAMKSRLKLYTSCPVLGHSPPGSKRAGEGPNGSAPPAPMST